MIISSIIGDDVQSLPLVSVDDRRSIQAQIIDNYTCFFMAGKYHLKTQRLMTVENLANNIALEEKNIIVI